MPSTLTEQQSQHATLQSAHHAAQILEARLQAEITGLSHRLHDRQAEIENLQQQLLQTRTQFEHYQEAIAAQRADERRQSDHIKAGLEAELADARKQISAREVTISQQMQQIGRLEKADHDLAAMTSNYQRLDTEFVKLSQNLSTQTAFALDLSARHETTSEALLQAQNELAILRNERPLLQSRNLGLEAKVAELEEVLQDLRLDKAKLEQRILMATQHQQRP